MRWSWPRAISWSLAANTSYALFVQVTALEMARGYDGVFRGKPEPNLIVAAYVVAGRSVVLAHRMLAQFSRPSRFPTTVTPRGAVQFELSVTSEANTSFSW